MCPRTHCRTCGQPLPPRGSQPRRTSPLCRPCANREARERYYKKMCITTPKTRAEIRAAMTRHLWAFRRQLTADDVRRVVGMITAIWPTAPVTQEDKILIFVGTHPTYGRGHYAHECPKELPELLRRATNQREAEDAVRDALGLPENFIFESV